MLCCRQLSCALCDLATHSNISGLFQLDDSSTLPPPCCDNQKCLHILTSVLRGPELPKARCVVSCLLWNENLPFSRKISVLKSLLLYPSHICWLSDNDSDAKLIKIHKKLLSPTYILIRKTDVWNKSLLCGSEYCSVEATVPQELQGCRIQTQDEDVRGGL